MSKETESTCQVFLQCVDFETLKEITKKINFVHRCISYTMPSKASTYVGKDKDLTSFIQTLMDYTNPENEESWRVSKQWNLQYGFGEDFIQIGSMKLYDIEECIIIPQLQTVFIVPGEKSVKGGINASTVITLNDLISTMPLVMEFLSVPDENDKKKMNLSVSFKAYEMPEPKKTETES